MMKHTNKRCGPFLLFTLMLLGGCGGGGGGGGSAGSASLMAISADNAATVSGEVTASQDTIGSSSNQSGGSVTAASAGGSRSVSGGFSLRNFLRTQLPHVAGREGGVTAASVRPASTQTLPCDTSGSFTLHVLSSDSVSVDFNDCVDAPTDGVANGVMVFDNIVLTGDLVTPPWSFAADLTFNNFGVDDGDPFTLNGATDFLLSNNGVEEVFRVSGASLRVVESTVSMTLQNFAYELTENPDTLDYTETHDGTLTSSAMGGTVTYETLDAFTGNDRDNNDPESGSMLITGADNATILLTATGGGNVTLEVDADGDGIVDADGVINTTWTDLADALP